jgi:hypothetical protein
MFIVTIENTNLCTFWPEAHSNVSLRHHLNTRHPRLGYDRHVQAGHWPDAVDREHPAVQARTRKPIDQHPWSA